MAVPKFHHMFRELLDALQDGEPHHKNEIFPLVAGKMKVSDDDMKVTLSGSGQSLFENRLHWTKTYLKKAGLIGNPSRGIYILTEEGKKVLQENPPVIDDAFLMRYDSYRQFRSSGRDTSQAGKASNSSKNVEMDDETPDENMENAYRLINDRLADNLIAELIKQSPSFFEHCVVKLLFAMGYGGTEEENARVIGQTGDNGLDGVIKSDRLGFDVICVQAKRWIIENKVGNTEIRNFAGALSQHGATKGVFVTTSSFTSSARATAEGIKDKKIILIDGRQLAEMMMMYDIGVTVKKVYTIKELSLDFFSDEED